MNVRRCLLIIWDAVLIAFSAVLALWLRFDGDIDIQYISILPQVIGILVVSGWIIFSAYDLYRSLWQFASLVELKNIVLSTMVFTLWSFFALTYLNLQMPKSWYFINLLVLTSVVGGSRFLYRFSRQYAKGNNVLVSHNRQKEKTPVMIIGAGSAGEKVIKEIVHSKEINKKVRCVIDDDEYKIGNHIHGIPVVGNRYDIIKMAKKYKIEEIFLAMPSVDQAMQTEILNICKETRCKLKKLPGIYQLVNGEVSVGNFREVEIEDLLGREPIKVNLQEIMDYVTNQVVMVTGGGGSIGSELCRQIAKNSPKQLIIVDVYENNAYDIQQELKRNYPTLNLEVMIASVRNSTKMNKLFETYRPNIVYHAAAHKHVPLMEDSPNEAIKNNVFGTLNVVKAADAYKTDRFILISTDKAVNPTNIMGATKRICEMIVQTYNKRSQTEYVAVRFGNVLGSNGSVIPLFKRQIQNGGPVTVTHPEITRYFMTIPEAVSLVLQAGAYAKGGEIFVLDMGKPVKIADLAKNLIKLSGYTPDVDIEIKYTGLRPGEKLYEELLMDEEGLEKTSNQLIHIGKPIELDEENFFNDLENLYEAAYAETDHMKEMVQQLVPTYHPNTCGNQKKEKELVSV